MEIEKVDELEHKIRDLIDKYTTLKEENGSLKTKVEEMEIEKEELLKFKQEAIAKVDKILNTLNEVNL